MQRSVGAMALVALWLLAPSAAASELLVSRGQVGYLADSANDDLLLGGSPTYIEPGVVFYTLGKRQEHEGKQRILSVTEYGTRFWGRREQSHEVSVVLRSMTVPRARVAFLLEPVSHNIPGGHSIGFGAGEYIEVSDQEEGRVTLVADAYDKLRGTSTQPVECADINERLPTSIEVSRDKLRIRLAELMSTMYEQSLLAGFDAFPAPLKLTIVDSVAGIQKPCDHTDITAIAVSGGGGLDISAFFAKITLGVETEKKRVQEFGPEIGAEVQYFSRGDSSLYTFVSTRDCQSLLRTYALITPAGAEARITPEWAERNQVSIDHESGRYLIICPKDFRKLRRGLLSQEADEGSAEFFLSRIARVADEYGPKCALAMPQS